jgi:uncharacterized alkaline shock family protein YloU
VTAPSLVISDRAVARIAAHVAATTPGVARLHPSPARRINRTARVALTRRPAPSHAADLSAVQINQDGSGTVHIVIRLIATADPRVAHAAGEVHARVRAALHDLAGLTAQTRVIVTAIDRTPTAQAR